MIIKKEIVIPERRKITPVAIVCDWCKAKSKYSGNWTKDMYDIEEVTIEYETGHQYPYGDGGDKIKYTLDLCPSCFKDKLIPLLYTQGVEFTKEEKIW